MKKYQIIVIDPPWDVKKLTHKARPNQVNMDYPTMSLEQIKALDIKGIADDKCWFFLWTTQKYLFESKSILEHWGGALFANYGMGKDFWKVGRYAPVWI